MKISESVHQDVVNGIVCYVIVVEHRNIKLHNVNVPQSETWVELQREQINPFFVQRHVRIPFVQQLEVFLVPPAKPIDRSKAFQIYQFVLASKTTRKN